MAVIRTHTANEIDGGLASSMRCLYEHFIADCSMTETGFTLSLDRPRLVFLKFSKYLADEAALCKLWSMKGASGRNYTWECSPSRQCTEILGCLYEFFGTTAVDVAVGRLLVGRGRYQSSHSK